MKNIFPLLLVIFTFVGCNSNKKETTSNLLPYPDTRKTDHIDTYFGTEVADPYRWLEDDNSEETKNWVTNQNQLTSEYLQNISYKENIKERLMELENYGKVSAPFKHSGIYYMYKNDGLQNQNVLYSMTTLQEEPTVFLDPNTFSNDGTISLAGTSWSKDGKYLAYMVSISGSDWREIYIKDLENNTLLTDTVKWAKFTSTPWYEGGFFYQRFDTPKEGDALTSTNQFGKIYYHKAGTTQKEDILYFENPNNPEERFYVDVSDDNQFLYIYSSTTTSGNSLRVKDLKNNGEIIEIIGDFENDHTVITNEGDILFIETNLNAPNKRLVKVSFSNPGSENWVDVIPETKSVLSISTAGGHLFANYLVDARTEVMQYDLSGKLENEVALPGIGTAFGFNAGNDETELFYTYTSFTTPPSIFKYEIETGTTELFNQPDVKFTPGDYETRQVFFESHDGTTIPMFITHKKGLELNGKNPTWLYSYGGFNISMQPGFNAQRILWLENGGVYAVPNIRGGGEYGEEWHEAGTKLKKKNVFKDFIAAANYLINKGYTSSEYLAVEGGSNGGLLIGATINMAPELAKVAFPRVGVMDMLRYQQFTIGRAWSTDYGTSEDSKEMFDYLHSYSPLHNIREISYPATMVMTADHDDRVVPAHSFKYGATLQQSQQGNNPVLMRIETKAGHGAGTPISKRIEQTADMYAFAWYNMGIIPEVAKKGM